MIPEDIGYIEREFRTLEQLCAGRAERPEELAALVEAGKLPRPAYVLPDGRAMFAPDLLALRDEAGAAEPHAWFIARYLAAAAELGETATPAQAEAEWQSYLGGLYAVCLRSVTPENIYRKERLVTRLSARLAEPHPDDPAWCAQLREEVEALDALERPFTAYDRERFGGPVSRDRLITEPRRRYPWVFGRSGAGSIHAE
jgi:hypothetical protein